MEEEELQRAGEPGEERGLIACVCLLLFSGVSWMLIAVEGCGHGELDVIYETLAEAERYEDSGFLVGGKRDWRGGEHFFLLIVRSVFVFSWLGGLLDLPWVMIGIWTGR